MHIRIIDDEFERLPGLFSAWDLGEMLDGRRSYIIEDGGRTEDGQPLFSVYAGSLPAASAEAPE